MCGGTIRTEIHIDGVRGLSPRVRGNLDLGVEGCEVDGSIPACAGEPQLQLHHKYNIAVYPRVCGGTDTG